MLMAIVCPCAFGMQKEDCLRGAHSAALTQGRGALAAAQRPLCFWLLGPAALLSMPRAIFRASDMDEPH